MNSMVGSQTIPTFVEIKNALVFGSRLYKNGLRQIKVCIYVRGGFRQDFLPRVRVDTKWVHKLLVTEWSVSHETKKNTSSQRLWLACF